MLIPRRSARLSLLLASLALHCTSPAPKHERGAPSADPPLDRPSQGGIVYREPARARWRLAPPEELERVVLWVSEIVIRHADVTNPDVSLTFSNWRTSAAPAIRTRARAALWAEQIAEEAKRHPERFAQLARDHSEEPLTSAAGGSLGGITAMQLYLWPSVLDALAATPAGAVSDVVETEHGFHVFLRREPPPEELLSGSSIVVGHDEAPWIKVVGRRPVPPRSKAEAFQLASALYEQVRRAPETFEHVAREHSDTLDADRGGDFGTWSTREPIPFPRELEVLRTLQVDEIAPPLETEFGYKILQRTANRARRESALVRLELRPESAAAARDATAQAVLFERARALASELARAPDRFSLYQNELCCRIVARVIEGRYLPAVESALDSIRVGDVYPAPVPFLNAYLILRRVDPSLLPTERPVRFDMPSPDRLNSEYVLRLINGSALENALKAIGERAAAQMSLPSDVSQQLLREHDVSGQLDGASDAAQHRVWDAQRARIQELLTPLDYSRYSAISNGYLEELVLQLTG